MGGLGSASRRDHRGAETIIERAVLPLEDSHIGAGDRAADVRHSATSNEHRLVKRSVEPLFDGGGQDFGERAWVQRLGLPRFVAFEAAVGREASARRGGAV